MSDADLVTMLREDATFNQRTVTEWDGYWGKPATRENALEALASAEKTVDDLCQGRLRWEMRVPAEPDHDPDLIIGQALRLARQFIEETDR